MEPLHFCWFFLVKVFIPCIWNVGQKSIQLIEPQLFFNLDEMVKIASLLFYSYSHNHLERGKPWKSSEKVSLCQTTFGSRLTSENLEEEISCHTTKCLIALVYNCSKSVDYVWPIWIWTWRCSLNELFWCCASTFF